MLNKDDINIFYQNIIFKFSTILLIDFRTLISQDCKDPKSQSNQATMKLRRTSKNKIAKRINFKLVFKKHKCHLKLISLFSLSWLKLSWQSFVKILRSQCQKALNNIGSSFYSKPGKIIVNHSSRTNQDANADVPFRKAPTSLLQPSNPLPPLSSLFSSRKRKSSLNEAYLYNGQEHLFNKQHCPPGPKLQVELSNT